MTSSTSSSSSHSSPTSAPRSARPPRWPRTTSGSSTSRSPLLLTAGIVLTGLNLRIAVASVPPIIDELQQDLGLSAAAAGVLTAAPVLCFGALAPVAPQLARRFGAGRAVLLALLPILVGVLGRAAGSTFALFAGTLLAGGGVAVANVLVPSLVKGSFDRATGAVTGLYVAALTGGAALAAGLTVPFERSLGWQAALALWALPVLAAAVVLSVAISGKRAGRDLSPGDSRGLTPNVRRGVPGSLQTPRRSEGSDPERIAPPPPAASIQALVRDPLAWQVTLYMGLQSLVFYAGLTWLPSILRDEGYGASTAGTLLALFALGGIPASLLVPVLATRLPDQRLLAAGVTALEGAAIAGLLAAPDAAVVWVALFALGQGGAIALALTLMVLRTSDPTAAAELSGMAQSIGYGLAAIGPPALGALHDWRGGWDEPLLALLAVTAPLLAVGVAAGRARTVADD